MLGMRVMVHVGNMGSDDAVLCWRQLVDPDDSFTHRQGGILGSSLERSLQVDDAIVVLSPELAATVRQRQLDGGL